MATPASRTFLSLSHPTHAVYCVSPVSCKSRCLTPYSNRECFGLVQNKKWFCKSNHFVLSSAIIEVAFLRHNFTPHSKIFNVLWTRVVRFELPGRDPRKGSETDQNGLWRHFIWLALLFLRRISTASETDETVTRLTQSTHVPRVHVSYAISFMSYDVSDLVKFPAVFFIFIFIFIIIIPSTTFRFLTFLAYKILL